MGTEKIVQYIVETSFDKVPGEATAAAKRGILDCLGVALVGCDDPGSKIVTEYVKEEGSKSEAGVIAGGFKTVTSQAAWVNGTLAHALDYDDYCVSFVGHPSVAILPAVVALGEKHHLSGKDCLLAYILGFEVGAKLGPQCMQHYFSGWHTTSTIGTIGAAAASARLLKLNAEQTTMALGIAASLASGLKHNFGTNTKPLHAGNAARNGVIAAELALRGFTAAFDAIEGAQGYIKVLGATPDPDRVGDGLGERYDLIAPGLSIKPYPSCAGTHSSIGSALALKAEHGIKPEEVVEIECRTSTIIPTAAIHNEPKTGVEGKFSTQYCVARALMNADVGLGHFTDEQVMQPVAQELIRKIRYAHPPEMQAGLGSEIWIKLSDGREVTHRTDSPKGESQNPMTLEDVSTKYKDCAGRVLSEENIEKSLDMIANFETIADIAPLMEILTSSPQAG